MESGQPLTFEQWKERLGASLPEAAAKLSDRDLRFAIHACHFDCEDYEVLMAEAEKRELDF